MLPSWMIHWHGVRNDHLKVSHAKIIQEIERALLQMNSVGLSAVVPRIKYTHLDVTVPHWMPLEATDLWHMHLV
jgi:hypothetical protein